MHTTFTSARVTTAETRLAYRRGGVNNYNQPNCAPNSANRPQVQPQTQGQVDRRYSIEGNRLSQYAAGCKKYFFGRMEKIRDHIKSKEGVNEDVKKYFSSLDVYFHGEHKGGFKEWIGKYESKLLNNAKELEEVLKKSEKYIDDLEKGLYKKEDLPDGKVFSERARDWAIDNALKNGIPVEKDSTADGCVIDVPDTWTIEIEGGTVLPDGTFPISGGRKRIHFTSTPKTFIKIKIGEYEYGTPITPGKTIDLKTIADQMESDKQAKYAPEVGKLPYELTPRQLEVNDSIEKRNEIQLLVRKAIISQKNEDVKQVEALKKEIQSKFKDAYKNEKDPDALFEKNIQTNLLNTDSPYKIVYEKGGKIRFEKDGDYADKANVEIDKQNNERALREITEALNKAMGLELKQAGINSVTLAYNIIVALRDRHDLAVYIDGDSRKLKQKDFGYHTDLEGDVRPNKFADLLNKDPVSGLRLLTTLPVTEKGAKEVRTQAIAALARYEHGRQLRYSELEKSLADLKAQANLMRAHPNRDTTLIVAQLNNILLDNKLVQPGVTPNGLPNLNGFAGRINSAIGTEPFNLPDGSQVRVEFNYKNKKYAVEAIPVTPVDVAEELMKLLPDSIIVADFDNIKKMQVSNVSEEELKNKLKVLSKTMGKTYSHKMGPDNSWEVVAD